MFRVLMTRMSCQIFSAKLLKLSRASPITQNMRDKRHKRVHHQPLHLFLRTGDSRPLRSACNTAQPLASGTTNCKIRNTTHSFSTDLASFRRHLQPQSPLPMLLQAGRQGLPQCQRPVGQAVSTQLRCAPKPWLRGAGLQPLLHLKTLE